MHISGKIFAFLTLCLAIAAVILAAKTLDKQNEWSNRLEKARADYEKAVAQVPPARDQVLKLRNELTLERLDWGRHWDNVQVSPRNLQQGQITIGIGRNNYVGHQGEAGEQLPLLHAFQPTGDGQFRYVGEFRVTQIDNTQAALQLSRTPRPGETSTWNTNNTWRFRDALPAAKRNQVGELLLELTLIEQRIKDRQLNLTTQEKSVRLAQNLLNERLKELNGNPDLPANAGEEYRAGLVESIKLAETARDFALEEVQSLRGELHELHDRFEQLLAKNTELEQAMNDSAPLQVNPDVSASSNPNAPR